MIQTCGKPRLFNISFIVDACAKYNHMDRSGESTEFALFTDRSKISFSKNPARSRLNSVDLKN